MPSDRSHEDSSKANAKGEPSVATVIATATIDRLNNSSEGTTIAAVRTAVVARPSLSESSNIRKWRAARRPPDTKK